MTTSEVPNPRLIFQKIPTGYPVPGETTAYDDTATIDIDAPLNGGILIRVLVLSVDPYQRGRMREPTEESYIPAYQIGKPLENFGAGVVIRTEHPHFKVGDHVCGFLDYQEYMLIQNPSGLVILENKEKLPWETYVGAAGMPGQTAYIGWKLFSKAKKGETVFVTTAGGPVGSLVVQIAKSEGLKVIASAGSDEKVDFAKEVGADVAFNYKTKDTAEALKELGHGIDIYWDNVGGATLETSLEAMNNFGRVINCGAISAYNAEPYGVKNLHLIITKRLTLEGFIILDHFNNLGEFYEVFPKMLASGKIKHREHVYHGLEEAEKAITDVQKGNNKAKAVIVLNEG